MNLADALAAEHQAYRKGPACSIATCLDALDKSDRAARTRVRLGGAKAGAARAS